MKTRSMALDGSGPRGGIALLEDEIPLETIHFAEGPGFGVTLATQIEAILARHQWRTATLDLLTVALGPGSFTGLRVALGLAKGISLVHSIPIVGISTLELVAAATEPQHQELLSLRDAGNGLLFFALYHRQGKILTPRITPTMGSLESLISMLEPLVSHPTLFCCGPGLDTCRIRLEQHLGTRFRSPSTPHVPPSSDLLGRLGLALWRTGTFPPPSNWNLFICVRHKQS